MCSYQLWYDEAPINQRTIGARGFLHQIVRVDFSGHSLGLGRHWNAGAHLGTFEIFAHDMTICVLTSTATPAAMLLSLPTTCNMSKATIYGSWPQSALSLPCITNKSLFFVFDRTSHVVPANRCPVFTGPRCSVILFITFHNANRKCALFGRTHQIQAESVDSCPPCHARWRNRQSTNVRLSGGTLDIRH